jgi:phosphate transport system substrate-binding protein
VKKLRVLCVLCGLLAAALACQTQAPTPEPRAALALGASTSTTPLLDKLTAAYREEAGGVTFTTEYGNARLTLDSLRAGRFHAALLSWPGGAPPEDVWAQPVALDALALIVHPTSAVHGLSLAEARDLFQGRTSAWADGTPVEVVSREDGATARVLFERAVMGDQRVTLAAVIAPGSREVVDYVAAHPGAIGYVSIGWLNARVRALALDGVVPSPESARAQRYALVTPVYFMSLAEPQGDARDFYRFVISDPGQALVGQRYGRIR